MIVLEVTDRQIEVTRALAVAIQAHAKGRGYKSWGGETDDAKLVRQHELGSLAELVAGDHFGLPFNSTVGDIVSPDLKVIEVRGRWNVPGKDQLAIRPVDKHLHMPYLLVRIAEDCRHAALVGWMLGREALALAKLNRDAWWNEKSGCWYIPEQRYHSVESLQHWLWVGAPRHTWKG